MTLKSFLTELTLYFTKVPVECLGVPMWSTLAVVRWPFGKIVGEKSDLEAPKTTTPGTK